MTGANINAPSNAPFRGVEAANQGGFTPLAGAWAVEARARSATRRRAKLMGVATAQGMAIQPGGSEPPTAEQHN